MKSYVYENEEGPVVINLEAVQYMLPVGEKLKIKLGSGEVIMMSFSNPDERGRLIALCRDYHTKPKRTWMQFFFGSQGA